MTQAVARAERQAVSFLSTAAALTVRGGWLSDARPATSTPWGGRRSSALLPPLSFRRRLSPTFFFPQIHRCGRGSAGGYVASTEAAEAQRWTGYPPYPPQNQRRTTK
jgi:hypothetical protein